MKNEIKKLAEEIYRAGVALDGSDFAHKSDHFERLAGELYKAGYRKQSETVKEFVEKAEQRFREDSKWLDIMLKGYDCKDSEDYDAVANAIIRGRFVNRLNDLATEYGKEDK